MQKEIHEIGIKDCMISIYESNNVYNTVIKDKVLHTIFSNISFIFETNAVL